MAFWAAEGWNSSPGRNKRFIVLQTGSGAHTAVPWALSPGVKRPGREADHSPPTIAEVKRRGSIHPFPHTSSWYGA
jgi:hypothetical protein